MTGRTPAVLQKFFNVIGPLLLFHSWTSYSAITKPNIGESPIESKDESVLLSVVLAKGLSTLQFEPQQVQELYRSNARSFVKMRRGTASLSERNRFSTQCLEQESGNGKISNPFCEVDKEFKKRNGKGRLLKLIGSASLSNTNLVHPAQLAQITRWIAEADIKDLDRLPERQLRTAVRKISNFSDLNLIIDKISDPATSCGMSKLGLILGVKSEEFLPNPDVKKKLVRLYEKVAQCGNQEVETIARFRASLMYLWENKCEAALDHLEHLISFASDSDYQSRALYWKFQCAKQMKNDGIANQSKETLLAKFPFTFHALLLGEQQHSLSSNLDTLKDDSLIQFKNIRSHPHHSKIKAVEALIELKELDLAREAMRAMDKELEKEAIEFRLYAGVLFSRMHSYGRNFKLLSSILRDAPTEVSKSVLGLYYPKNIKFVSKNGHSGVDRMLLLSLIRQESAFNAGARSTAGALGLMQLMPNTARRFERIRKTAKLLDPEFNVKIGSKYFSSLLNRYNGDTALALAAYNAGERRIDEWVNRYTVKDRILFLDLIPFKETRSYVSSIARNYFWYVALDNDLGPTQSKVHDKDKVALQNLERVFRLVGT